MKALRWVLLGVALTACAPSAPLRSPAQGGRPWTRVQTENFRVFSDLDAEEVRSIAAELEQDLAALNHSMFVHPLPRVEDTDVVVFARSRQFYEFVPQEFAGIFYRKSPVDPEAPNVVVAFGALDDSTRVTLLHELTHDLFAQNFGAAPTWLNEGWAEYYSTVSIVDGNVRVGSAPPDLAVTSESYPFVANHHGRRVLAVPLAMIPAPSQLLKMSAADFYKFAEVVDPESDESIERTARYFGAWAFVHMLRNSEGEYSRRFSAFFDLAGTAHVDEAWSRAFAGVDEKALDSAFRQYLANGELAVFISAFDGVRPSAGAAPQALSDGEVHLLWARLFAHRMLGDSAAKAKAQGELKAALGAEPALAEAYQLRGLIAQEEKRWGDAEADFQRATELAPHDPRFLFSKLMSEVQGPRGERSEGNLARLAPEFERLGQVAQSSLQLLLAADYLMGQGRSQEAMQLAERAATQSPADPNILSIYAALLEGDGRLDEAMRVQQRALAFVYEDQRLIGELQARLSRLEARISKEQQSPVISVRPVESH